MFDISWQELALIAIVAVLVIPPKDLPRALATAGQWIRRAKAMIRDVQSGVEELAREAELSELRKQASDAAAKMSQPLTIDHIAGEMPPVIQPKLPEPPPAEQTHE
jgi:sec-independent protein translocase protein TatB